MRRGEKKFFFRNRYLIVILCLILVYICIYYSSNKNELDQNELKIKSILDPLCVDIKGEEKPTILNETMEISMVNVNYTDRDSLENFCKPYVYTKLFLRLGMSSTGDCDPLATKRGTNCEWYHMCVWPESEDVQVSKFIQQGSIWDPYLTNFFINSVKDKKPGIVIDAGANIGQFTITAAMLGHQVIAFEPIPQHIEMIKRSLALNGASNNVHLFRNGLADYFTETHINLHKDNKGGSTIESIGASGDETVTDIRFIPGSRIPIHLVTIDSVFPLVTNRYPDYEIHFWKADIEGYESRMFRGAWKFLSRYRPTIMFEVLGKSFVRTKCDLSQLFYGLLELKYSIEGVGSGYLQKENVIEISNEIVSNRRTREVFLRPEPINQ